MKQENSVAELEKKIHRIQKSTRTFWRHFHPLHNHLRMKLRWYYNWHLNPFAHLVHVSILGLYLIGLGVFGYTFFQNPSAIKAASEKTWATAGSWSEWQLDGLQVQGDQLTLATDVSEGSAILVFNPEVDEVVDWLSSSTIASAQAKTQFSTDNVLWSDNIDDLADSKILYTKITLSKDEVAPTSLSSFGINYSRYPMAPSDLSFRFKKSFLGDKYVLVAGGFSDPDADLHAASQWQVTGSSGDYSSLLFDSGSVSEGDLNSYTLDQRLSEGQYYFRVRYQDSVGAWSLWSKECGFVVQKDGNDLKGISNGDAQLSSDPNEIISARTETTKTIDNKDNTKTLEAYTGIIHYKEDYAATDSQWKDINPAHSIDAPDYVLYDQMPSTVKVFKDKIGYEIESRKTGDKYTVVLKDVDGAPVLSKSKGTNSKVAWADINTPAEKKQKDSRNALAKWITPEAYAATTSLEDSNLKFEFEIGEYGVRLWKTIKGSEAPKNFKWDITKSEGQKTVGVDDLKFRDNPEAFDVTTNGDIIKDSTGRDKVVAVEAKKVEGNLDSSFVWQETAPTTNMKIDTDVIFYPDSDPETTTVDGTLQNYGSTWSDARDSATASVVDDSSRFFYAAYANNYDNLFYSVARSFFSFDLSSLTGETVTAATFSAYGVNKYNNNAADPDLGLYCSSPFSSNVALSANDFSKSGNTPVASTINYADFTTTGYNNFSLNAAGKGYIQSRIDAGPAEQFAYLSLRSASYDVMNTAPSTIPGQSHGGGFDVSFADDIETSQDPKLAITYPSGSHISGIAYNDTIQSGTHLGAGIPISLSVNGGAKQSVTTDANGAFDFTATGLAADLPITVFIDDPTDTYFGTLVTVLSGSGDLTGLKVYNGVGLSHENAGPLTNAILAVADNCADPKLKFSIDGSNKFGSIGGAYVLAGKTYRPGGVVESMSWFYVYGTLDMVSSNFDGSMGSPSLYTGGTINAGTGTFSMSGYHQFAGTFNGNSATIVVGEYSFILDAGIYNSTSGNMTLDSNGNASNFVINGGTFNHSNGQVIFTNIGSSLTANITSGSQHFYDLTANSANGTVATLDPLNVDNSLVVSAANAFNASASTVQTKDLTLSSGSFTAPSSTLKISGDYVRTSGSFDHNIGTVELNGAGGTTQRITNSDNFYNFTASATANRTIQVNASTTQTVFNTLSINGTDASKKIILTSSSPGTRWNIDPQGSKLVSWVTVSDSTSTNPIDATNSTEGTPSSTTNWLLVTNHTLTYTAGANGSIVGTSPQTVADGGNGTEVVATPAAHYHWVSWSDAYPTAARTDLNVTTDITVSATFAIDTYTLTYSAGANGSIVGSTPQTVNYGADGSQVTATAAANYHFTSWSDGVLTAARTDTNVTANKSVTASFAIDTYTLSYSAGPNGSIVGTSPQTVNHGADGSQVTATAAANYHFTSWSDGVLTAARTDTNITGNITVTASFAIDTYTLTYSAGANGSIVGTSPQTVSHGADGSQVTATPAANYHFTSWSDGVLTAARTDTNVTGNITVTASFAIDTYTLTYSAGANGSIVGTSPQTVNHGANGSLVTATPAANYHFTSWSDGVLTAGRTDLNVTGNITVTASFAIDTHTLSYSAGAHGSISGTSPQTVNHGANGSAVSAVADSNYHFVSWSDGVLTAVRTDTNVAGDITVSATFAVDTRTITSSVSGSNGSISPLGVTTLDYGTSQSFVITPSAGYYITDILVDGIKFSGTINNPHTYAFTNVIVNHTIQVSFTIDNTCVWDGGGSDTNWSSADNWSGNALPTATCDVVFNSTSTDNSVIDLSFTNHIKSLSLNAGYTGTLTANNDLSNDGDLNLAAGIFEAGDYTLNIGGSWNNTGGTFVKGTSTVKFVASAAESVVANSQEFYNLTFAGISTITTPNVWVANYNTNNVSKISSSTGAKTADYATGAYAYGVAVDASGFVWVTNITDNTVSKINASTGEKVADYATGVMPRGVAVDASGFVWVANSGGATVSKINPTTGSKTNYSVGANPYSVAIDAAGFAWVTNNNATGTVSKINISTGAKVADYSVGQYPIGVAVDQNNFVWVANSGDRTVSKINGYSGVEIGEYATLTTPTGVAVDNDGNIWIANYSSAKVTKINGTNGSKIADYSVGTNPYGVSVDVDGFVWVANIASNTVTKISSSTGAVIGNYPTGTSPYSIGDMTGFALKKFVLGGNNDQISNFIYTASSNISVTNELRVSSGSVNLAANSLSVNTLVQTGGYFQAPSTTLSVSGNIQRTGGIFAHNNGTLSLVGAGGSTQVVDGSNSFYNFSATASSARTIRFAADSVQFVAGTWTARGAVDQLLVLALKTGDTGTWGIYPLLKDVDYVDVSDSVNYSLTTISPLHYSVSSLTANNVNWFASELISHTITASVSGGNGTITPTGAVSVVDGGSQTFTMTPASGYHIFSLAIDSEYQSGTLPSTYTFSNVTSDHTIVVAFAANDICIWDGEASDNKWSSAANWSNNTVPGELCDVIFNSSSTKDSAVDTGFTNKIRSLTVNSGYVGTVSLQNDLNIDGDFSLNSGSFDASDKTINLAGSLTLAAAPAAAFRSGTGTINFTSQTAGKVIRTSGQQLNKVVFDGYNFTINSSVNLNASGTTLLANGAIAAIWTLQDNLSANSLRVTNGTLVDAGKNVTVAGDIIIQNKTGVLVSTGLWTQSASGNISNRDYHNTFGSLTIAGEGVTTTLTGTITVGHSIGSLGRLTMGPGTINGNKQGIINYFRQNNGVAIQDVKVGSALAYFQFYPVGATSQGAIKIPDNFASYVSIQKSTPTKFSITGDLDLGNNSFRVSNDSTNATRGFIEMGTNNITCGNLVVGPLASTNVAYSQIAGNLRLSGGSLNVAGGVSAGNLMNLGNALDLGTGSHNIGGNFNSNFINIISGSSTVNLTGGANTTQVISGSATFNNLTALATTARSIRFAAGTTQTINGLLTIKGSPDQLITLALKTGDSGVWSINPSTWDIDYVNISNSVNLANDRINPVHYVDGGGNTNWFADAILPITAEEPTSEGPAAIVNQIVDSVTKAIDNVVDNVVDNIVTAATAIADFVRNTFEVLAETPVGEVIQVVYEAVAKAVVAAAAAITNVLSKIGLTPEVTSRVAAATAAVVTAVTVAAAPIAATGSLMNLGELAHGIWQPVANLVTGRRRRNWGRVIEDGTGAPIQNTKINLVKVYRESPVVMYESQKVVASTYTDKNGKYGFIAEPGKYKLEIIKDKYDVVDTNSFLDFYHTNTLFEVKDYNQGLVIKDIAVSTSSENLSKMFKVTHLMQVFGKILAYASFGFLVFGTISIIPIVVGNWSWLNAGIIVLYALLWVSNGKNLMKKSPWGIVVDKSKNISLPLVLVRVVDKKTGQLVKTAVSNEKGRFSTFIDKGDYEIRALKAGYVLDKPIRYVVGKEKATLSKKIEMSPI